MATTENDMQRFYLIRNRKRKNIKMKYNQSYILINNLHKLQTDVFIKAGKETLGEIRLRVKLRESNP